MPSRNCGADVGENSMGIRLPCVRSRRLSGARHPRALGIARASCDGLGVSLAFRQLHLSAIETHSSAFGRRVGTQSSNAICRRLCCGRSTYKLTWEEIVRLLSTHATSRQSIRERATTFARPPPSIRSSDKTAIAARAMRWA